MKKLALVITCLLLQSCISLAVSPEVTGTVVNESGEPIIAEVTITNLQLQKSKSITTDKLGNYAFKRMRVWVGPVFSAILLTSEVSVQAEGYMAESKVLDNGKSATANFNLVAE
ncbi:hypothetical protein AAOGI_08200 [Agarivorans albus]